MAAAADLSQLVAIPRETAALSSTYSQTYAAAKCIDSLFDGANTLCATAAASSGSSHWAAVRVAAGAPIGTVAVYNRRDNAAYSTWLGTVEVWIGAAAGDDGNAAGAVRCGAAQSYDASSEPKTARRHAAASDRAAST